MNILQGIGVGNRTVVGETIHFLPRIKLPGKKKSNKSAQEEQLRFQKSFTEFISSLQMKAKVADENLSNIRNGSSRTCCWPPRLRRNFTPAPSEVAIPVITV